VLETKRFLRSRKTIGHWKTPLGEPLEGIVANGLTIPPSSKSDYKLLKWAIGIRENPRPIILDSDYKLVLTVHSLAQQDYQTRFSLDWENDHWAKLGQLKRKPFGKKTALI
jgi:hypothetical protein